MDMSPVRSLRLAALFAIVAIGGCASAPPLPPPPTQLPPDDYLIVPGTRIGPVAIGMTSEQVLQVKGSPDKGSTRSMYNYHDDYRVIVDDKTQQVLRVDTRSVWYSTAEGVKPGQSELDMRAKMGTPDSSSNVGTEELPTYLYCYDRGLAVYIFQGKIYNLSVFLPGGVCK
ncbi:MAG TPA: hypothetical protein VHP13_07545 [Gammaproteobacteria bacterium]|nr:hypothetical protein [Gammaproteobacteria bacterium]